MASAIKSGFVLAVILCITSAAFAAETPASKPSSQPALVDLVPLQKTRDRIAEEAARERMEAKARWERSPEQRNLKSTMDSAKQVLDRARASGAPQEKLDASRSYNTARIALEQATDRAIREDKQLADVERARDDARRAFDEACLHNERIQKAIDDADPMKRAAKEGRVIPGMTLDEARRVLRSDGRLESETRESQTYLFIELDRNFVPPKPPFYPGMIVSAPTRAVRVTFVDGKADTIEYSRWRSEQVR